MEAVVVGVSMESGGEKDPGVGGRMWKRKNEKIYSVLPVIGLTDTPLKSRHKITWCMTLID